MRSILLSSIALAVFAAWAVPATAGEADAPPPPSAESTACCCQPIECCKCGWTVSGSALLLKVRRTDTEYAIVEADGQAPVGDGGVRELDFDHDLGFRTGIRWATGAPCCWDFGVTGTFLSTDASDSVSVNQPSFILSPTGGGFASAAASIDEDYLVVDLDVGHTFCGPCLEARVFGGLRFASIQEDRSRTYVSQAVMGPPFTIGISESTDAIAVGIHAGIEPRWRICRNFSVFGRIGAGILFGDFDWTHQETNTQNPGLTVIALDKSLEQDLTVIEGALGVSWECDRLFGCVGVRVSAGIEHTRWDFVDFKAGPSIPNVEVSDSAYSVGGFFLNVDLTF